MLGNLTTQERAWWRYERGGTHNNVLIPTDGNYWGRSKERYGYDPLQRLLSVDRQVCNGSVENCAYAAPVPERHPYVEYAYDAVGNITRKTDFADVYAYGTAASSSQVGGAQPACGPNALLNVVTSGSNIHRTYQCDNNGNQVAELMSGSISGTRRVLFNGANLPARIDHTCLASQIPWTRVPRICVSPLRVRRPASTLHRAASIRPVSPSLLSPIPAIAAT